MFESSIDKPLTSALFDFDGTLVDASEAICAAFNETLRSRGMGPLPDSSIRVMIGRPLRDMFRDTGAAASDAELDICVATYRAAFMPRSVALSRLLPNVAQIVPVLAKRLRLGVVTNRMSDGAWRMLRAHGLDHHFSTVVGIERVRNAKPDPEPVMLALDELGAAAHEAMLVGDTVDDVVAGRRAGVWAVGVTTGSTSRAQLQAAGAHTVIDSVGDLAKLLGL